MIVLTTENSLENVDLTAAFQAVKENVTVSARFKKKEDLVNISKSILKHRIQTLTGRNIKKIEEEMKYRPVDVNETGMNIDVMKKLAHCLILLAEGELEGDAAAPEEPAPAPTPIQPLAGKKRPAPSSTVNEVPAKSAKVGRRSLAASRVTDTPDAPSPARRGRKSIATPLVTEQTATPNRLSRRSIASTSTAIINKSSKKTKSSLNTSDTSEASVTVRCMGPVNGSTDKLQDLNEEMEEEVEDSDGGMSNPTPAMKEMMKKRKSLASTKSSTPAKRAAKESTTPDKRAAKGSPLKAQVSPAKKVALKPAPALKPKHQPRPEFIGLEGSRTYLMAGEPLGIKLEQISKNIPLSVNFPGAHLAVVHTPAEWTPSELFSMTKQIKYLNKAAGLSNFVVLIGTGLTNVHMNIEAMMRHTKHVQFITFHREDANKDVETGKLRETTSFFLAGYFFPGCDKEGYTLPHKMVRDGYTTSFRTSGIEELETSIIDCFSEKGEWVMDFFCGKRKLTLAAAERGRNGIAVHHNEEDLEELGDYLRTAALKLDPTYRQEDGLVVNLEQ